MNCFGFSTQANSLKNLSTAAGNDGVGEEKVLRMVKINSEGDISCTVSDLYDTIDAHGVSWSPRREA